MAEISPSQKKKPRLAVLLLSEALHLGISKASGNFLGFLGDFPRICWFPWRCPIARPGKLDQWMPIGGAPIFGNPHIILETLTHPQTIIDLIEFMPHKSCIFSKWQSLKGRELASCFVAFPTPWSIPWEHPLMFITINPILAGHVLHDWPSLLLVVNRKLNTTFLQSAIVHKNTRKF